MSARPRLLDLFAGAGGAGMGYHRAGFEVVGVDHVFQKNYPFEFIQADALEFLAGGGAAGFDAIHASPPCQAHTSIRRVNPGREYEDLIPQTREALVATGLPFIIENVPGAKTLRPLLLLCGTMFGLRTPCGAELRRHRYFEVDWTPGLVPQCQHGRGVITIAGHCAEDTRFANHVPKARTITVTGATPQQNVIRNTERYTFSVEAARIAMGIDWGPLPMRELSQAIPPAYTELIGKQLLATLGAEGRAA
jgi:DNA (cytosine-5)-methyltransferase 1